MSWTTNEHPIKELATGEILSLKTYTIQGSLPGPHIHIQASVHGAELQGNAVILKLMEYLNSQTLKGSITFIPLANPYATNNKHGTYTYGRYNPVTGHNWNRNYVDIIKKSKFDIDTFAKENLNEDWTKIKLKFKSALSHIFKNYEKSLIDNKQLSENNKLNLILQNLAHHADGILDLHTGPVATRYLYSANYQEKVAPYLLFKHVLIIPDEFGEAMDEACFMPWVYLKQSLDKLGRAVELDIESFTLEFGSEESFCMQSATKDVESIINYLKYKKVLEGEPIVTNYSYCSLKNFKTIYSPRGGLVDYHFTPGQRYLKGDTLASFYNLKALDPSDPITSCLEEVKAETDGLVINRCPSSSIHQGMELYQVMMNPQEKQL